MQTNSKTADSILRTLNGQALHIASLPNTFKMCDARTIAFADLSSAIELCALYLADFITTNDKAAARKYLPMATRVSEAAALLSGHSEKPPVGRALLSLQGALIKAHGEFSVHCRALAAACDVDAVQA
jgi:hypothetical protein